MLSTDAVADVCLSTSKFYIYIWIYDDIIIH